MEGDEYRAVLQFYGTYLMQNKMPSAKRSSDTLMLQMLIFKLSYVSSLPLLVEVLALMQDALSVFISEVKRRVPGSQGRDGVIESSEQLPDGINEVLMLKRKERYRGCTIRTILGLLACPYALALDMLCLVFLEIFFVLHDKGYI
jgi:hypothetical protein